MSDFFGRGEDAVVVHGIRLFCDRALGVFVVILEDLEFAAESLVLVQLAHVGVDTSYVVPGVPLDGDHGLWEVIVDLDRGRRGRRCS